MTGYNKRTGLHSLDLSLPQQLSATRSSLDLQTLALDEAQHHYRLHSQIQLVLRSCMFTKSTMRFQCCSIARMALCLAICVCQWRAVVALPIRYHQHSAITSLPRTRQGVSTGWIQTQGTIRSIGRNTGISTLGPLKDAGTPAMTAKLRRDTSWERSPRFATKPARLTRRATGGFDIMTGLGIVLAVGVLIGLGISSIAVLGHEWKAHGPLFGSTQR
ncbi:hypothetical protein B0T19DRAFT_407777 [Cercophora scortea]|uniref:Uncharacterized protein n=1 Tax=Cercophora scortea TaxID=314031 RepID=A0AAE0MKV7_9PEZI|nr:hypothetical protein B0T19DRAFT_407777 [Cercophora scortea]